MKTYKTLFFTAGFFLMLGTTIWAGQQQNLLTEFSWTGSPMWFKATLVDFYINQIILWLWVCALEKKMWIKGVWLILFVCFGSMGTCAYALMRVFLNKPLIPFQREGGVS